VSPAGVPTPDPAGQDPTARATRPYGRLIIEEDGVPLLLRLIKEGRADAQESAVLAIGLLGHDPECVDLMILAGVCTSFVKILKDAPMMVQGMVAWAISELAANHPKCQDAFLQHNVIRLLVAHLAFETVQEHSKYVVASKMSIHAVVMDKKANNDSTTSSSQEPPDAAGVLATTTSAAKLTVGAGGPHKSWPHEIQLERAFKRANDWKSAFKLTLTFASKHHFS
jgi:hypothetical protein